MIGLIANPPSPVPTGLTQAIAASGNRLSIGPDGWTVDDLTAVQTLIAGYSGSAAELQYWQAQQQKALATEYAGKFASGFNNTVPSDASGSHTYQIDPASQANIAAMGSLASATLGSSGAMTWPSNFFWVDAANNQVAMTAAQMLGFAAAAAAYVSGLVLANRSIKDTILAASTTAAAQAIDVTAGWPSNP